MTSARSWKMVLHDAGRLCETVPERLVPVFVPANEASGWQETDRSVPAVWLLGR